MCNYIPWILETNGCPPKNWAAATRATPINAEGFCRGLSVPRCPGRRGHFFSNETTALMPGVLPRLALLDLIADQRERSVYEVNKFSVRSGDEQGGA